MKNPNADRERVEQWRRREGLSMRQVASRMNASPATYSRWVRGERELSDHLVEVLSDLSSVPASTFRECRYQRKLAA